LCEAFCLGTKGVLVKPSHECFPAPDLTWENYTGVIVET